jgi:hypothetical protein
VRVGVNGSASGRQQTDLTDDDSARSPWEPAGRPLAAPGTPSGRPRQINTTTTAPEEGCT